MHLKKKNLKTSMLSLGQVMVRSGYGWSLDSIKTRLGELSLKFRTLGYFGQLVRDRNLAHLAPKSAISV